MESLDMFTSKVHVEVDITIDKLPLTMFEQMVDNWGDAFGSFYDNYSAGETIAARNNTNSAFTKTLASAVRMKNAVADYIATYTRFRQKVTEHLETNTPWSVKSLRYLNRSDINAVLDANPHATRKDFIPMVKQIWETICITCSGEYPGSFTLAFQAVSHYPAPSLKQLFNFIELDIRNKFKTLEPDTIITSVFREPTAMLNKMIDYVKQDGKRCTESAADARMDRPDATSLEDCKKMCDQDTLCAGLSYYGPSAENEFANKCFLARGTCSVESFEGRVWPQMYTRKSIDDEKSDARAEVNVGIEYTVTYQRNGMREQKNLVNEFNKDIPDSDGPAERLLFELQRTNGESITVVDVEDIDVYGTTTGTLEFKATASWNDIEPLLASGKRLNDLALTDVVPYTGNMSASKTMFASIDSKINFVEQNKTFEMDFNLDVLPSRSMTRSFIEGEGHVRTEVTSTDGKDLT